MRTPNEYSSCRPLDDEMCRPALRVVTQGVGRMTFGDAELSCSSMQAFLVDQEMPARFQTPGNSLEHPFSCISIDLDITLLQRLMREVGPVVWKDARVGAAVLDVRGHLADCALRFAELQNSPKALGQASSLVLRELHFWLLVAHYGPKVLSQAPGYRRLQSVAAAMRMIRDAWDQTVPMPVVARAAAMSQTSFHQHFKALTGLTPLQYQKILRMIAARRLLMSRPMTVIDAGLSVGYKSPSQFSREYSRLFGIPPAMDSRRASDGRRSVPVGQFDTRGAGIPHVS